MVAARPCNLNVSTRRYYNIRDILSDFSFAYVHPDACLSFYTWITRIDLNLSLHELSIYTLTFDFKT